MVVFKCHEDYLLLNNSPALSVANGTHMAAESDPEAKVDEDSLADSQQIPAVTSKVESVDFRTATVCAERTKLEKLLALLLVISVVTVGILIAALIHSAQPEETEKGDKFSRTTTAPVIQSATTGQAKESEDEICTTPGCVEAAAYLIGSIDRSVDPCDDFYQFACGRWNAENPVPDDKSRFGTFSMVRERLNNQMKSLLENNRVFPDSQAVKMTRHVFRACLNTSQLASAKSYRLLEALRNLGGLPLLSPDWTRSNFTLSGLLGMIKRDFTVADPLFQVYVYADEKNTSNNVLHIDQPSLSLGAREYYLNEQMYADNIRAYMRFINETAMLMARDSKLTLPKSQLKTDIQELFKFEQAIANISTPQDEKRNATAQYHRWTIAELKDNVRDIDWDEYFQLFLPTAVKNFITNDTPIIVLEPAYLAEAATLAAQTSERIRTNYLLWRVVKIVHRILDDRFQDIAQTFMRVMTGKQQKSARWKECVTSAISSLDMASGAVYVAKHFESSAKKEAKDMIANIVDSFRGILRDLPWMDKTTKQVAIQKVDTMVPHIGYPDFLKNMTAIDEYYQGLEVTPSDSYFDSITKVSIWSQEKQFKDLLKPFDRHDFDVTPAQVNAFYSPEKNAIMFPAGILQPPFFRGDYPKAINYGAMGAVIGHEITHGFDDQGSQYDYKGNLQNWWSRSASLGFKDRTKCIVDQYSDYHVPDINMNVNGKLTQGENIADNGGMKATNKAYKKATLGKSEPRLPGLNMTNDQLLFLSFASFWCGNRKPQAAVQQILVDSHSPETFRVIGVMSNSEDFARAYNCPRTSRMNPPPSPKAKCEVW